MISTKGISGWSLILSRASSASVTPMSAATLRGDTQLVTRLMVEGLVIRSPLLQTTGQPLQSQGLGFGLIF